MQPVEGLQHIIVAVGLETGGQKLEQTMRLKVKNEIFRKTYNCAKRRRKGLF
jgi:hypothetical protein